MNIFLSSFSPFLFISISSTLGILFGKYTHFYIGVMIIVPMMFFYKKTSLTLTLCSILCIFLGYIRWKTYPRPIQLPTTSTLYLHGTVLDKGFLQGKQFPFKMTLSIQKISLNNTHWDDCFCIIQIYSKQRIYAHVDDIITTGPYSISEQSNNSYSEFLQKEGISASLFCDKFIYKRIHRPSYSLRNWLFWQREFLQIKLFKKLSKSTFALYTSLFMGNKLPVNKTLDHYKNDFKYWGISHYLARSGLHLLLFIIAWSFIFNYIPLRFLTKQITFLLLIIWFTLFSWPTVSFFRAFGMYSIYTLSLFNKYRLASLSIILFVYTCFILYKPYYLFALDFQLSFLLSFCLLWIAECKYRTTLLQ